MIQGGLLKLLKLLQVLWTTLLFFLLHFKEDTRYKMQARTKIKYNEIN